MSDDPIENDVVKILESSVYIVPHATKPAFKLGKGNDVITRLRQVARDHAWGDWISAYDWSRGIRLAVSSEKDAYLVESSLRKIPWVSRAVPDPKLELKGVEWHQIDVFERLLDWVERNAADYGAIVFSDLLEMIQSVQAAANRPKAIQEESNSYVEGSSLAKRRDQQRESLEIATGWFRRLFVESRLAGIWDESQPTIEIDLTRNETRQGTTMVTHAGFFLSNEIAADFLQALRGDKEDFFFPSINMLTPEYVMFKRRARTWIFMTLRTGPPSSLIQETDSGYQSVKNWNICLSDLKTQTDDRSRLALKRAEANIRSRGPAW